MTRPAFSPSLPLRKQPLRTRSTRSHRPRVQAPTARASRRSENVPGNIFVDTTCIDCDTCRWLAPETFHSSHEKSAVYTQPEDSSHLFRAMQAMSACPTGSIRTEKPVSQTRDATRSFPTPALDDMEREVKDVFYNGFASKDTFGASSWLVVTEDGNVMFDCPRFFEPLAKNIEEMGGLKYIVLSHRDDVAGHEKWAERFSAERVIHENECSNHQGTDKCEIKLGDDADGYQLLPGLKILLVPGHTKGSIAMLHEESKSLFTGDHLGYSERIEALSGFPRYCRYSWGVQLENIGRLADVEFLHGFPGHGRQFHFKDENERRKELGKAVESLKKLEARAF